MKEKILKLVKDPSVDVKSFKIKWVKGEEASWTLNGESGVLTREELNELREDLGKATTEARLAKERDEELIGRLEYTWEEVLKFLMGVGFMYEYISRRFAEDTKRLIDDVILRMKYDLDEDTQKAERAFKKSREELFCINSFPHFDPVKYYRKRTEEEGL